jgi:hypothetical protein
MQFFDGELDTDETIEALLPAFPLRVRIGRIAETLSRTGDAVGGAFAVHSEGAANYASIPGTKSGPNTKQQTVTLESGEEGIVGFVWTLLGSWPAIKRQMLLQVVDINGTVIGPTFEVLLADVHDFGIHTEVRTRAAS